MEHQPFSRETPPVIAPQGSSFMGLPPELHIHISSFLTYPDALALKHSCRHFYYMVNTGILLKVDWLVERFGRKLECPMENCSFRTDESFCNQRIRRIMERRRRHLECRRVRGGCWVVEGRTCQMDLVPGWLKRQGRQKVVKTLAVWGQEALIVGLMSVVLGLLWHLVQKNWWHDGLGRHCLLTDSWF